MNVQNTTVCIFGMHRSGTSCLTGCLQECGLFLGEVVNKAPYNKKGNRENLEARGINEQLLALNNSSWHTPPVGNIVWNTALEQKRDAFIMRYADKTRWGFKDPRTVFTLPFWHAALPNMKFIASFRHPLAVARSHAHRDGFAVEKGLGIWRLYNLKLLEYIEQYHFPLICFDWPVDIYQQVVVQTAKELGLSGIGSAKHIGFFAEHLRHYHAQDEEYVLPDEIIAIHRRLLAFSEKTKLACLQDQIIT